MAEPTAPVHAEASAEGGEGERDAHDDEGEGGEGEGGEGSAQPVQLGPDGQPLKKRRRRRRRKKAGEAGAPGAEGAETAASGEAGEGQPGEGAPVGGPREPRQKAPPKPRRDPASLPFSRYVPDLANRRGIFLPSEIVAGKVVRVEHGVAVLDLFGKAFAFVADHEPREIAAAHEPEPEEAPSPAADPATVAGALAKLDGQVGMPASESIPPPPPVDLDGDGIPDAAPAHDDGEAEPGSSDPTAVARAASALRQVGTPTFDADGDGVPDDLELAGEGAHHETAHGQEEAPAAHDEAQVDGPPIEVGSIFRGRIAAVSDSGHLVLYNRRVVRAESRARLAAARAEHRRVFGLVYGWNRGGFDVLTEGLRAFCPISGLSLGHVDSPEPFIGQRLEFSVQQAKSGQQGIVVTRRGILEREAKKRARELRKSLAVGQTMKGRVTAVRDFGLIVDVGGLEGLVHLSEVSWDRQKRPADVASVGDEVDVKIIRLGSPEPERGPRGERGEGRDRGEGREGEGRHEKKKRDGRIGLSIKATQANPFDEAIGSIEEGSARRAKVMRVTDFGAFVELVPGVEGLLHVSELGREVTDARQKLKDGDEIVVVIERVDPKARRIALSLLTGNDAKLFEEGQLPTASGGKALRPGAMVKVRVEKVEPFGVIVQIDGVVGKRGRGFIPNNEMGTDKGTDHRKKFPPGTELEVKIIGVDRDGGLKCSKKALAVDEERKAVQAYRKEAAAKGLGTFGDLLKKKLEKRGFST